MPMIDIQVMEGVFDEDEQARMISAVSEGFGNVAGQAMADARSVRVHEVKKRLLELCWQTILSAGRDGDQRARLA